METKHKTFKPFDKVLVREGKQWIWRATFYSHYNPISGYHYTTSGAPINDILPYEDNEHLIGTTDEPDEEVKLEEGEFLILSDVLNRLKTGTGILGRLQKIVESCFISYDNAYGYAIRFSDFNPNDMGETKKHILCVKNGKIVRYKNN